MRKFIIHTLYTVVAFSIGIALFAFLSTITYKKFFDFKLKDKVIILGHSHPACAFDDALIEGVTNMAQPGEPYFYTYFKLKELLSQNTFKTIFLEYSNNQISAKQDEWIWGYNSMNAYLPRHLAFMDKEDVQLLYDKNREVFKPAYSKSIKQMTVKIVTAKLHITSDYGGYEGKTKILTEACKLDTVKKSEFKQNEVSETNLEYLDKIVKICEQNKVQLYFVRSPQHPCFNRSNESIYQQIKKERYPAVELLDFDQFPLTTKEFSDYGHVNKFGAQRFSSWFQLLLEKGLLTSIDKEAFVQENLRDVFPIKH